MVEGVVDVEAELNPRAVVQRFFLLQRKVEIGQAGPDYDIASGGAEGVRPMWATSCPAADERLTVNGAPL
jgi:hypothetical protein